MARKSSESSKSSKSGKASKAHSSDVALKELREFGLRLPGAHTKSPWPGHLDLAVKDKTFAYLSIEGEPFSIGCKLPDSAAMALNLPFTQPTPYGLGKSGWVSATPPAGRPIPVDLFKAWIEESYRAQAPKRLLALLPQGESGAPERGASAGAAAPRAAQSEPQLDIEVLCTELPGLRFPDGCGSAAACYEPVHLGIQRGREVIDEVPADRKQAKFTASFRIGRKRDGSPNFLGPYAQGPIDDRFFYLTWGVKARKGPSTMFRRLKIRTGHLSWSDIERSQASGEPIRVTLRLTDARGAPLCATPPASHIEWQLPRRSR